MIFRGQAPAVSSCFKWARNQGLAHVIDYCAAGPGPHGQAVKPNKIRKTGAWQTIRLSSLGIALFIGGLASNLAAQQAAGLVASDQGLPDAPGMGEPVESGSLQPSTQPFSSTISGSVLDPNGDVIAGARVALSGTVQRVVLSGSNGEFVFSDLPPGTYKLTVTSEGMGTLVSAEIPLLAGEMRTITKIVLPVAATATEVRVVGDPEELAEEQVHIAVEQRVLGILPNFYSVYDWNAPPLGPRQKFTLAYRATTDPVSFVGAGVYAGVEQEFNIFPGYHQGLKGYTRRFSAEYTDDATGRFIGSAVLPSVLHQDPRYFYRGSGRFTVRAAYAIGAAFFCRGDNGHWQPNYSHLLGSFSSGALSNLYYPAANRGFKLTIINGLLETFGNAGNNLLREFFYRGLTSHVPSYENGKP